MAAGGLAQKLSMSLEDVISKSDEAARPLRGADGRGVDEDSECRVFVGNLPYSASWQDIKDHMRQAGSVEHVRIIPEPGTALGSKGCAIVTYSSANDARKAIALLSETQLKGRPIFLREDREPGRPAPTGGGGPVQRRGRSWSRSRSRDRRGSWAATGGGGRGGWASGTEGCRSVYVGNLPYSATWQDLKDHMRACGHVVHCDILPEPGTAMGSKGCGIVEYATAGEARRAIRELSETTIKGRAIFVREDRESEGRPTQSPAFTPRARGGGGTGCRVFVGNLAYSVTAKELKAFMEAIGEVVNASIVAQPGTACGSKGCGLVEFRRRSDAEQAIRRLTERSLKGRPVFVREDREEY